MIIQEGKDTLPPVLQTETGKEPYPNTTLGVLRRLKGLAQENNLVELQTENLLNCIKNTGNL